MMPALLLDLWAQVAPYVEPFMLWRGYERELQTLLIYAVGIALYAITVYAFYQNISKRRAFAGGPPKPGFSGWFLRMSQRLLVFPPLSLPIFPSSASP